MVLDFRLDDGAQALDQQQQLDFQRGYQVIDAANGSNLVTAAGLAVDVAGGDINAGGTTVSCAAASDVPLTAADPDQPRVDVVYRDGNGAVQVKDGTPATVEPAGGRDRDAYQPAPHDMHDIDGVVLATVWVSAGATSIGSGDIRDRRLPASLDVDTLNATSVSTDKYNTTQPLLYRIDDTGRTVYALSDYSDLGAALSQAFSENASESNGYADYILPAGGGRTNQTINLPAGQDAGRVSFLIGHAMGTEETLGGTLIRSDITDGSDVILVEESTSNKTDGAAIRDLGVDGNGSEGAGVRFKHCQDQGGITNVGVNAVGGIGIDIGPDASNQSYRSMQATNASEQGLRVTSSVNLTIINHTSEGNAKQALLVNTCGTVELVSCELDGANGNVGWVAQIKNSDNVTVDNCVIQNGADFGGLKVDSDATQVSVKKSVIKNNSSKGVKIAGSRVRFEDCRIDQSNTHVQIASAAHRVVLTDINYLGAGTKINAAADATDVYADLPTFNGEQAANPSSSTYTLSFDTAFTHYPRIDLTADAAVNSYSNWTTDANGNYTGVDVSFGTTPSNVSWEAIPRNVGV